MAIQTRRGMPHPVVLASEQPAATLAQSLITIQGKVIDTDQIEALVLEYRITLQSSNLSQQSLYLNSQAQQDEFVNNLFGGVNGYKIELQSPDLGQIISPQITPAELFRSIGAACEVYPEGPLVGSLGVDPISGLGLAAATGKIENMVVTFKIPFAVDKKLALGYLFAPLGKQFKGGGLQINAPIVGVAFTDPLTNTWSFGTGSEAPRLKVSAIVRPSGASDGIVSPLRWVCNKSADRETTLSGDFIGLNLYMGTVGNVAFGLDAAKNLGQYQIRVDGMDIVAQTDSNPRWSKEAHKNSLFDPTARILRTMLQQPGAPGTGVVQTGQGLASADYASTVDMPLLFIGSDNSLGYSTVCGDKFTISLQDEWFTQTPVVKYVGCVVWPLSRIGASNCGCGPASSTPGQVVGPPDGSQVPQNLAENFLPRFSPAA